MFKLHKFLKQKKARLSSQLQFKNHFHDMMRFMARTKLVNSSADRLGELPWYLVVGASQSGKTSLLNHSGLKYILRKESKGSVSMQAKSQQPQWWATREAVLVDVPGQLWQAKTSQQKKSWQEFLHLIKRYRCPIAGIIITISAQTLLRELSGRNNEAAARHVLLARLQQMAALIKHSCHVYLVVTQCDVVPGFSDYFATLDVAQQQQPLGFYCPKKSKNSFETMFYERYQQFIKRLHQGLITQLHRQRDPNKRDAMQRFPVQLEQCQTPLLTWVKQCYTSMSSNVNMQFSGVYFTSSAQDPAATSKSEDEVSKHFALQVYEPKLSYLRQSKAFFITQLFQQVIFNTPVPQGLCSPWRRALSAQGAMVLLLTTIVMGVIFGLYQFQTKFRAVTSLQHAFSRYAALVQGHKPEVIDIASIHETVNVLSQMNTAIRRYAQKTHSIVHSLGTQQARYDVKTKQAYQQAIEQTLIPQLIQLASQQLQQRVSSVGHAAQAKFLAENDIASLYRDVKAYLMLVHPKKLQATFIIHWLQSLEPHKSGKYQHTWQHLASMLQQDRLLEGGVVSVKAPMVQVLKLLRPYSVADLMYFQIKQEVLASTAYANISAPIPSWFATQETVVPPMFQVTYTPMILEFIKYRVNEFPSEQWLLAQLHLRAISQEELAQKLTNHYWQDYLHSWHQAITQFKLPAINSLQEAITVLTQFADVKTSPLKVLSQEVCHVLERVPERYLVKDTIFNLAQLKAYSQTEPSTVWQSTLNVVQQLQEVVGELAQAADSAQAAYIYAKKRFTHPATQDAFAAIRMVAQTAPQPIQRILEQLADQSWQAVLSSATHYVNSVWKTNVYPYYAEHMRGRYPFTKEAKQALDLKDFSAFFSPHGILARFNAKYLQDFIDTEQTPWVMRTLDGQGLQIDETHMAQLQYAYLLQRMFFAHNDKQPQVDFILQLTSMTPRLMRFALQMGEQSAVFQATDEPVQKHLQWPDSLNSAATRLVFMTLDGGRKDWTQLGVWSLFKVLDQAKLTATVDPRHYFIEFEEQGEQVTLEMITRDDLNPFIPNAIHRLSLPAHLS